MRCFSSLSCNADIFYRLILSLNVDWLSAKIARFLLADEFCENDECSDVHESEVEAIRHELCTKSSVMLFLMVNNAELKALSLENFQDGIHHIT